MRPESIDEIVRALPGPWLPVTVATANDTAVRVAMLDGAFEWHDHDEDELFLCWEGAFRIELEDAEPVELQRGDLFVVPRNTRHRPIADAPAVTLLLEKPETLQYGNVR